MEHVISDECLSSIRRKCYEAGASGREVYTSRGPDGPEVVRCRDCIHFRPDNPSTHTPSKCSGVFAFVHPDPDGFCSWGRRADEDRETGGR